MTDLDEQLLAACEAGDLPGVRAALTAGAEMHKHNYVALRTAAHFGHLRVVKALLLAGADKDGMCGDALRLAAANNHLRVVSCLLPDDSGSALGMEEALRSAAEHGYTRMVRLLRKKGARISKPIVGNLRRHTKSVQTAMLASGDIAGLSVIDLAHQGVCPEALGVLLERQGQAALAAMITATQMLDPMDPAARAGVLAQMLAKQEEPGIGYAKPE